jgi:phage nucleotide-binding protein
MAKLKMPEIVKPVNLLYLKCLVYGDPGIGKTRFLGTAQQDPRTNPMLVLDFEGGTSTLAGLDIDVARIRSWEDYEQMHAFLEKGDHPYKSVAIDSVSETHWHFLKTLMDNRADDTRKIEDVSDQQEYGQALVQLRNFLRGYRDLPLHVFFTAHAKEERDPREGMVKKPSLAGKAANEVLGIVDVGAYMCWAAVGEGKDAADERIMVLKNWPRIRAKTRTRWDSDAPDQLIRPTITALLDAVNIPRTE